MFSLRSYLQVYQTDLDGLSRQMRESKRNSRLVRSDFCSPKKKEAKTTLTPVTTRTEQDETF